LTSQRIVKIRFLIHNRQKDEREILDSAMPIGIKDIQDAISNLMII